MGAVFLTVRVVRASPVLGLFSVGRCISSSELFPADFVDELENGCSPSTLDGKQPTGCAPSSPPGQQQEQPVTVLGQRHIP